MATPIIIPVPTQAPPRNCIIEAGVRYCESTPITPADIGYIGLFVTCLICWALAMGYYLIEREEPRTALMILFAPFVGMAIWGVLWQL